MPRTALGVMIQAMREQRGLSQRELGRLAEIDHAYIHRLESGDKEAPSEDVVAKLVRTLKLDKRDADILKFTAAHPKADPGLIEYVAKDDRTVPYEVFTMAAGAVYRADKRPD